MAVYEFTKETVSVDRITLEIESSNISSATYQYASFTSPDLNLYFDSDLSSEDYTTLSGVVDAHTGEEVYEPEGSIATATGDGSLVLVPPGQTALYYGAYFTEAHSENTSNTSSTSLVTKVTLNTPTVVSGTYRVGWYFEWQRKSGSGSFRAKVKLDDDETLMYISEKGQYSYGSGHGGDDDDDYDDCGYHRSYGRRGGGNIYWQSASGCAHKVLEPGEYTISLKYGSGYKRKTNYIRRARLEFWRVL